MRPKLRFTSWKVAVVIARNRAENTNTRQRVTKVGDGWAIRPAMPRGVTEQCS